MRASRGIVRRAGRGLARPRPFYLAAGFGRLELRSGRRSAPGQRAASAWISTGVRTAAAAGAGRSLACRGGPGGGTSAGRRFHQRCGGGEGGGDSLCCRAPPWSDLTPWMLGLAGLINQPVLQKAIAHRTGRLGMEGRVSPSV